MLVIYLDFDSNHKKGIEDLNRKNTQRKESTFKMQRIFALIHTMHKSIKYYLK